MKVRVLGLIMVLAMAACAGPGEPETSPTPHVEPPAATPAAPSATTPATPQPRPLPPSPTPLPTEPLVLAVHHSRPASDVPLEVAHQLQQVGGGNWADLGQPGGPISLYLGDRGRALPALDVVMSNPNALALVPVSAVDERVRVLSVDGVDPLLTPDEYAPVTETSAEISPTITTVSIVGDIMLGRRVGRDYSADPTAPLHPFAEQLAAADITVGNFEATLSDNGSPTQGGDSFAADPAVLEGLHLAGFDAVSLANNHLGDYRDTAMLETFDIFEAEGIAYFGGGPNLERARAPWIIEDDGVRIGFIGTESIGETPAATAEGPGTNRLNMPPRTGPLDVEALERIAGDIGALAAEVDTVIVLPHWGTQYTHVPEPIQHEVAARFVEAGADLVIGGHPHWVQGWEAIGDATVVHSLGNFIFDMQFSQQVQEGVFVEIVLWDGEVKAMHPVPYVIRQHIPQPADEAQAAKILADMRSTSSGPYAS